MHTTLSLIKSDTFSEEIYHKYSRFKHGSKTVAREFGKRLAHAIKDNLPKSSNIVVYPAPYNNVPTASSSLKDYLLSQLSHTFYENSISVKEGKIHRLYSYDNDYGNMSKEERRLAISSDQFSIDKNFFNSKDILIFIDDIKITGSHEERIRELLERENITNEVIFIYLFEYTGQDSTVEHRLNHGSVNNLKDINNIIANDKFIFNTRVIKYILKADIEEFVSFITYQSDIFQETLHHYSILNMYHTNPMYSVNFGILHNILIRK